MKRSKEIGSIAILLASVALIGCGQDNSTSKPNTYPVLDSDVQNQQFASKEECALNIGEENCEQAPAKPAPYLDSSGKPMPGNEQRTSNGGGHGSFIWIANSGYRGGYLSSSPRYSNRSFSPSSRVTASPYLSSPSISSPSTRGGFGASVSARGSFGGT